MNGESGCGAESIRRSVCWEALLGFSRAPNSDKSIPMRFRQANCIKIACQVFHPRFWSSNLPLGSGCNGQGGSTGYSTTPGMPEDRLSTEIDRGKRQICRGVLAAALRLPLEDN